MQDKVVVFGSQQFAFEGDVGWARAGNEVVAQLGCRALCGADVWMPRRNEEPSMKVSLRSMWSTKGLRAT